MTVHADTLEKFTGKQVILHKITEDGLVELTGKIDAASAAGVAFKEKGKRDVDLILPHQIEEIDLAPSKPKVLKQKNLKPLADGTARQHLLDRHGYSRAWANSVTEEAAVAEHDSIDHSDLGHQHVEPEAKAEAEAEGGASEE